ncbi:uncharacterized protein ACLA_078000 [Aspergillus clavatus NRRL 1]|uniref:Uncharacterized protein n=1 Tax=Aspergillus clavatus (strain ATCC 1007 / CBS 513.65 / DSM 816 / NCTC 3887 / NRRL 1 / QM 1276 / 107) TaxID=344612 RepID=A1CLS3_ASPCL|nr:uncharacterized protein ACLA_078000 [Aspergillus clavatus NRRL 1]EAW09052.1 conserved hypothetical protein [Aspergillus clavatus NRRL 1]
MMKSILFLAAITTALAAKTCTPSFDYCATTLVKSKGFSESDLNVVLKTEGLEAGDLNNVLFHCKNPGDVGHAKLCSGGCKEPAQEGSHSC